MFFATYIHLKNKLVYYRRASSELDLSDLFDSDFFQAQRPHFTSDRLDNTQVTKLIYEIDELTYIRRN
jgi:hypothetical protein